MTIILFGVSGAGKTLIGELLAEAIGWKFFDADRFHSAAGIEKMSRGIPLTDEDREPWLESLCGLLETLSRQHESAVLACSALRERYRQRLAGCGEVRFVFLKGDHDLIRRRLEQRHGHFMPPELLRSQFETLEEPPQGTVVADVAQSPEEIVEEIRAALSV